MSTAKLLYFFILLLQLSPLPASAIYGQVLEPRVRQDSSVQRQTEITGHMVTGKIITICYSTMPGNNPLKNKNWVGIWQGSQILYDTPPLRKAYIPDTESNGDFAIDSLSIQKKEYIVGFGNGTNTSSISATLYFKADNKLFDPGLPFFTKLEVLESGNNYLVVKFSTPLGNIPADYKNWIGVWNGQTFLHDGSNLIKRQNVNSTISEDTIAINNLTLIRGVWYTITYGIGPELTEIVASYSFINY